MEPSTYNGYNRGIILNDAGYYHAAIEGNTYTSNHLPQCSIMNFGYLYYYQ
jgi:hypothetical protein